MAEPAERITSPERMPGEGADRALRPQGFDEFVGQPAAKANLKVFVEVTNAKRTAFSVVLVDVPDRQITGIRERKICVGSRNTEVRNPGGCQRAASHNAIGRRSRPTRLKCQTSYPEAYLDK